LRLERRAYRDDDLDDAFLVFAATSDTELNVSVFREAERRTMLVNVVDVPPLCNFIMPAIARSGPISIAVSTKGASPALAKRLRSEIAETYGEPYAQLAEMLNDIRAWARDTLPTYQDRKVFFEAIVNGDPDPIELLRRGDVQAARELIAAHVHTVDSAVAPA
ncbi:MAG TPA: bifunctional precorrin-2 dehydrogenase/sirohydrochlorin ferrochelatase, partial [Gaiellales bacterium]